MSGIGGQSIRSTRNNVTKQLGEETKISQALIEYTHGKQPGNLSE